MQDELIHHLKQRRDVQQLVQEGVGESYFDKLDVGRQADVIQCLSTIKNSNNPKEVAMARRSLQVIYREYNDSVLRDARRWLMKERAQGRHENVKNFYEDVERDPNKYNPFRTRTNGR